MLGVIIWVILILVIVAAITPWWFLPVVFIGSLLVQLVKK